jgi:micrococcal nuclease
VPLQPAVLNYFYAAKVINVVDGDTVKLLIDVGFSIWISQTVRLIGINAPEISTPEGKAAKEWLAARMLPGLEVYIQTTKDKTEKYGRLLGKVFIKAEKNTYDSADSFNDKLVAAGMARPYDGGART